MALFYVVRRAASSVAPVAFRAIKQQRFIHSAVGSAFQNRYRREITKGTSWVPSRAATSIVAKSKFEENLLAVLDEEIQCAVESDPPTQDVKPKGTIPFEIEDLPGVQTIELRRKYGNEEIKVEVLSGDNGDGNDEEGSGNDTASGGIQVNLTVSVAKGGGPFLEFICTGYADAVSIEGMAVKQKQPTESDAVDPIPYEGPPFNDLDENLQKGFHKYLEVRGITPSLSNYLCEYMINKESKEYTNWLKNVKEFVEK